MTGIHSRARKSSLSVTGILAVILFVGQVCVPRELRAGAASRIVSLVEELDAALADAWQLAFPARGSDHAAAASASHKDGALHSGAQLVLTGAEALRSGATGAGTIDANGFGTGSFMGSFGAGSAPKSMAGLLSDILKEDNLWAGSHMGFEELAGSFAGTDNASAGFRIAGYYAAGVGASSGEIAPAGFSFAGSAASHGGNVEGMPALAVVNPNAHNAYPDAHQRRVEALGRGLGLTSDAAGASGNQVGSSGAPSGFLSTGPGNIPPVVQAVSGSAGAALPGGDPHADSTNHHNH